MIVQTIMSQFMHKQGKPVDKDLVTLDDPEDADEDVPADEETDGSREAADELVIENMDEDHPDLVLSPEDVKLGQMAVDKVRHTHIYLADTLLRVLTLSCLDHEAISESLA